MTSHLTTSTLPAYRTGRTGPTGLSGPVIEQVDNHLLACARCRTMLGADTPRSELMRSWRSVAAEIGIDDALDADVVAMSTRPRRRSGLGRYGLVAACLLLVAVAAVLVAVRQDPPAPAATPLPAGFVDLGSVDDLAPGQVRWFEQHRLFLVRTDTEIFAFSQRSPKSGCRLAKRDELDTEFFGSGTWFADPCHGSAFLLDGTQVGGPFTRGMYRYQVDAASGRIIVDLRLVIPGPSVYPGLVLDEMPTPGPGVVDDLALGWLAAAGAAVEPVRDGNDGPMLRPLGAFHDANTGIVTVPAHGGRPVRGTPDRLVRDDGAVGDGCRRVARDRRSSRWRSVMRVWIDQDLCTGYGLCTDHCPEVFMMLEDGMSYVREAGTSFPTGPGQRLSIAPVARALESTVIDAALECPGECIFIEEEATSDRTAPHEHEDVRTTVPGSGLP
ncbi:MAG: ferredoxin [Ilumatobacteraceae bacterium]